MCSLPCHPSRISSVTERLAVREEVSRFSDAFGMARVTIAVTSVHKTLSELCGRSGRDDVRGVGDDSCFVRVTGSSFSTPGFTPGSLPVLLPIPGRTHSHSIALVQTDLLIVSMRTSFTVALHLTRSLSPLIALLRRRPSRLLKRLLVCASPWHTPSPVPTRASPLAD